MDEQGKHVDDLALSLIRTWVPIGVGSLVAWLATRGGLVLSPHASATAGVVAAGVCAAAYYAIARALEQVTGGGLIGRAGRALGRWMLGGVIPALSRQPVYAPPPVDEPRA